MRSSRFPTLYVRERLTDVGIMIYDITERFTSVLDLNSQIRKQKADTEARQCCQ